MSRKPGRHLALVLAIAVTTTACGGGASTGSRSVAVSGSSTVEPISARNAEKFSAAHPEAAIRVEGPGTGDGFKLFCAGDTDISGASRPIKDSEAADCAANGVEWIELQVAIDGISVLTNLENEAVTCLDTSDIYALVGPESIGFARWSDANALAAAIGAPHGPYPDAPLDITAPGEESGTFDTFVEFVIDGKAGGEGFAETREADTVRPDYVASANDNVIIEGISGSEAGFGWVGYAFYAENRSRVKAIDISSGGGGCVAPTPETIASGAYPLSRPLFMYVNKERAAQKPEVAAYVDLYLSEAGLSSVAETGYVPLEDYTPVIATWQSRTVGRVFS